MELVELRRSATASSTRSNGRSSASATSSSSCCSGCSPTATCCSRTCPASPRRSRRARSPRRPGCVRARAVHPRPAAGRRHRLVDLEPARRATSSSARARSSPTSSSPTRSTARRRRRRRRCSRRCRSTRSRSTATTPCARSARSSCSRRRTRSSTRGRTRCRRPSSTASCCGPASATRDARPRCEMLARRIERASGRGRARRRSSTATTLLAMQAAVEHVHVGAERRRVHRRPRARDAGEHQHGRRREPARQPRAAQARALPRRARRARLRDRPTTSRPSPCPALAHRLVLQARALGAAAHAARTSCERLLDTVPTPSRRGRAAGVSPRATPRLTAYLGRSPLLGLLGALALTPRRARRRSPPRSRSCSPRGCAARAPGVSGRAPARRRPGARRRRDHRRAEVESDRSLSTASSCRSSLPRGVDADDGARAHAFRLDAGEEREVPLALRLRARWGSSSWATFACAPATASARPRMGGSLRPHRGRYRCTRAPSASSALLVSGSRRRRRRATSVARVRGDGHRVRRHAPLRRRATGSARSTGARPRGAALSSSTSATPSATPTSCSSSTASPTRASRRGHPRARSAGERDARRRVYLERRDRVGLVTFGGVLRWLEPRAGAVAALPAGRRAARDGRRVQLRVEGRQRHPGAHPATHVARDRSDAAARPARSRCPARPACARPRPRRRRGRPRSRTSRARPARLQRPTSSPSGCGSCSATSSGPLRSARHRRRALGRRPPARRRTRGGEGIPSPRQGRAALITGALALAALAGVAAATALAIEEPSVRWAALAVDASAVALLALGLVVRAPQLATAAAALVGGRVRSWPRRRRRAARPPGAARTLPRCSWPASSPSGRMPSGPRHRASQG